MISDINNCNNIGPETFFGENLKKLCGYLHVESAEKEIFGSFVDFGHICSNTKFDKFFEKKATCANANTPDFDLCDSFFMLNKLTKKFGKIEHFTNFRNNI